MFNLNRNIFRTLIYIVNKYKIYSKIYEFIILTQYIDTHRNEKHESIRKGNNELKSAGVISGWNMVTFTNSFTVGGTDKTIHGRSLKVL